MIRADLSADALVAGEESDLVVRFVNCGSGTCFNLIFKLVLPRQIVVVGGGDRIEVPKLPAGDVVTRTLRVRPVEPGTWVATSTNFSYRDRRGTGRRIEGFEAKLRVAAAAPKAAAPEPELVLTLPTANLPYRHWRSVTIRIDNVGAASVYSVTAHVSGQLKVKAREHRPISQLRPGEHAELTYHVCADDRGDLPVFLDVEYMDSSHDRGHTERTFSVSVGADKEAEAVPEPSGRIRILYLAANPLHTNRTRWELGFREIEDACRRSRNAARFELVSRFAVRDRDIGQSLIDVSPQVVQFSGHGSTDGLQLESGTGRTQLVAAEGLVQLFGVVAESVNCVIFGVCYSKELARDLSRHTGHAIGMAGEIDSRSMINFSIGFYQAFAAGRPVAKAFETGRAHIALQQYNRHDQHVPRLFVDGQDAT
jgi:hypothetical protein